MSIRFSLELTDPHTENLLRYLDDALGDNYAHKLEVLSSARQWLELEDRIPTVFTRGEAHTSLSLRVVDDERPQDAVELSRQPSLTLSA
jgi:hypothetical protein